MNILPANKDLLYIEWAIKGERFILYRSTNPDGPYEILEEHLNMPYYLDDSVNVYDASLKYWYKVEGYSDSVIVDEDGPESLNYSRPNPIANKVIHEANVALKVMRNPGVWFLLKRRGGATPCPICWNPETERPKFSNCDYCGGTGVIEGYHQPVPARVSQDVSQLTMASGPEDNEKVQLTPIRAWTVNVPLVYPEDVMVDVTNQRFKITNVARRTVSQYVVRQILDLTPLSKGHPSYNVEVDWRLMPY